MTQGSSQAVRQCYSMGAGLLFCRIWSGGLGCSAFSCFSVRWDPLPALTSMPTAVDWNDSLLLIQAAEKSRNLNSPWSGKAKQKNLGPAHPLFLVLRISERGSVALGIFDSSQSELVNLSLTPGCQPEVSLSYTPGGSFCASPVLGLLFAVSWHPFYWCSLLFWQTYLKIIFSESMHCK